MKHSAWATAALAVSATLVVAACGSSSSSAPTSSGSSAPAAGSSSSSGSSAATTAKFLGCMVADTGTINDKSFNQSAWAGMQAAAAADSSITVKPLPSSQSTNAVYQSNINTFLGDKCGIIVTVGFLMAQVTQTSAQQHPTQNFAIVDNAYKPAISNVSALVFNTVQDGFLGGYLAAGMSKTGKVATFGGQELPTVTIYMDGFWDGVQYYNSKHSTHVQVLGWNEQTQKGEFVNSFTNITAGDTLTQTFINEGADIIFPVAGDVGNGAAKAITDANKQAGSDKYNMLWVDTDGCVTLPQYCGIMISSVTKGIESAVKNAVVTAANGTFKGGNYIGTLANGGVLLAPFHDFASKVPQSLQSELTQLSTGIQNGSIQTPTKSPVS